MSVPLKAKMGKWVQIDTKYAVLVTGGPYRFFMGGNTAPDSKSASNLISGPQVIPQGVGAHISGYQGDVDLVLSPFVPADEPPFNPIVS